MSEKENNDLEDEFLDAVNEIEEHCKKLDL
jgi:hypothetical protein